MRLLLVEDNIKLTNWLTQALSLGGYVVDAVPDGMQAEQFLLTQDYDVVVLDLGLPSLDGLTLLRRLRERGANVPVLVLTARAELGDRVAGLNQGADDYLAKPFELAELEARLHALIRRAHGNTAPVLRLGSLAYDSRGRVFNVGTDMLVLRPKEHAVLEVLMLRAGKAISKEQLYAKVFAADATTGQDVVEVYVHRLRKRLQGSGATIVTLRGLGYLLEEA
jgi:two-component system response regulator TctD